MSDNNSFLKSGIRDNLLRGTVHDFLEQEIKSGSALSVVSAYFTIYAYEKMQHSLNKIEELRFLFGDPDFVKRMDPNNTDKKAFDITDTGLELNQQLRQKPIAKACAEWIKEKVEIRTTRGSNLIHGKMYHIANKGVDKAILGSSNFTVRGLGLSSNSNNVELNLEVDSDRDRTDLKTWFDEIWNNDKLVEDVKETVLAKLKQIGQDHPPELIYYKTLYELFREEIETRNKNEEKLVDVHLYDTEIWKKLYQFQKEGVKSVIARLLRHNGCILADSVGLGKTYTALAVIKFFELRNERVLVLCPKKLRENWALYPAYNAQASNEFLDDKFGYSLLSHTDLSRYTSKSGDIDLLIATDCVSEGQNLQDCDTVLNYDIHWNPVRIIQRFGRIDRIGSKNKEVKMINYWPTEDMEVYLRLQTRVASRMALADATASGDDDPLNDFTYEQAEMELNFRDAQLEQLRKEVLDLDDLSEGVVLSDFTLDYFFTQLLKYLEKNRAELDATPDGAYTVTDYENNPKENGVIFFLQQRNASTDKQQKSASPIYPYYIVYIRNNGDIRYGCANAKQVLDLFEAAAIDKDDAIDNLCLQFDIETEYGNNMGHYNVLLDTVISHIIRSHTKTQSKVLRRGSPRDSKLTPASKAPKDTGDFKLVTWLIITSDA